VRATAESFGVDFSYTYQGFGCGTPPGCDAGYGFTATQALTIDALGVWNDVAQQLQPADNHPVGLWNSEGTLLASATVTSASTPIFSPGEEEWFFTFIPPLLLTPGQYVIGAFYPDDLADLLAGEATAVTAPGIILGDPMTAGSASLSEPNDSQPGFASGFFGPNFLIIPEPASVLLLALGLGGVALARMRQR